MNAVVVRTAFVPSWLSRRVRGRAAALLALASLLGACGGGEGGGTTFVVQANSCNGLLSAVIDDVTLENARIEPAANGYPEHCLVRGRTSAGRVSFELRSPVRGAWNGRLMVQGTGGFAGQLDPAIGSYREPTGPGLLAERWAVLTTDSGHRGNQQFETYYLPMLDGSWALDNPQAEEDFAWRGARAATAVGQRLLALQQNQPSFRTYWVGCSGGGRMGMKLAEKAPELFDGFVVGGPPLALSREMARAHWNTITAQALPLPPAKLRLMSSRVMARCDALDGAADGVVSDPERCDFNPFELQCSGADGPDCLTQQQATAAWRHYRGARDAQDRVVAPGLPATGSEDCSGLCDGNDDPARRRFREGWAWWFAGGPTSTLDGGGPVPLAQDRTFSHVLMTQFFRYMAQDTDRPTLRWFEFDPVTDPSFTERAARVYDVQRVDFSDFRASGKRVLMYSGWADAFVSPLALVDYLRRVEAASGGPQATREVMRLFMVPGMQHCEGGRSLDEFDAVGALVDWVEFGRAPDRLRARNRWNSAFPGRERDLCPYPQVSTYRGAGSIDDPASFECRAPAAN